MTFGFSRDDAGKFLASYYDNKIYESDPFSKLDQAGVGRLVQMSCELGRKTRPDIKLGICGEQGGDPSTVEFCHNVGLTYVSCSPSACPLQTGCRAGCYQEPPQVRVLSFTIGFDEAQTFYKSHGYGIKPSKWHDLTVEVYI